MKKAVCLLLALLMSAPVMADPFSWDSGYQGSSPSASDIKTDTTNFNSNLSSADDTVQDALDTLDNMVGGSGITGLTADSGGTTTGATVTLIGGTNVTTTRSGDNITIDASGGGAPTDADYLVGTANGSLSAEIVVGTSPGGELGGTWASPTIDDSITVDSWTLTNVTISSGNATVTSIAAGISGGLLVEANNGTDVGLLGVGNTANATWYGVHNFEASLSAKNGATTAGFINLYEDSDNGTNFGKLIAPASTADVTWTLPASTGTVALTSDIHAAVTVTDSSEIDFTLTGQDITASLINGSIDEARLDASTNASLDLADTALQAEVDGSTTNELQNIFQTIATTSGTSPVADSTTDTLTITAGSGITVTGDSTTDTVTIAATGGGGTPGGADTQIQVNESSAFQGYADFTFDSTPGLIVNESGSTTVDTRFESDVDTHAFFLDASTNSIGFNDSTPTEGKWVFIDSANAASMYVQNTSNNTSGVAGQFWLGNGGGTTNIYTKLGLFANSGAGNGNSWMGGLFNAGDNGGTTSLWVNNAGPSGDAFDYSLVVTGGSSAFLDTDLQMRNGSTVIFALDESSDTITIGSATDLGGLLGVDGKADEVQLLVQGNGTQTSSLAVFETSAGTDVFTLSNAGVGVFAGDVTVPDEAYGAGWNGSLEVPTKNAVYDKIETLGGGSGDNVSVDGVAVTDPNFASTGDIDFVDTANVVTANLNADVVGTAEMADADHGDVAWSGGVATVQAGTATTAGALAANGGNCAAGEYPLGVDAAGAVESCTDATTEISSAVSTHEADVTSVHELNIINTPAAGDLLVRNAGNTAFEDVPMSGDVTIAATGATTIAANSVALTTDTTGNYAAGDAEAGAALTGDSATSFFSAGTIEGARLGTFSKSFTITGVTSAGDFGAIWKTPSAITITRVNVVQVGATNVVGHLDECDSNGATCSGVDGATDITADGNNDADDGALSNASIDANDWIGWHTTSVSGTNTRITVTYDYTVN